MHRPVVVTAIGMGLLCGLAVARHCPVRVSWWWLLLPAGLLSGRRRRVTALLVVATMSLVVGLNRGATYAARLRAYDKLFDHRVAMVAQAADDGVYTTRYQLAFDAAKLRLTNGEQLLGTMSVSGFGMATVHRGDIIEATGKLYPARGNNLTSMSFASLHLVRRAPSRVERWRRSFVAGMQTALPEPLASFGLGLLVGQRNTLPADVSQALLTVGLTHIIAVSGYNLTIILDGSRRLFGRHSKFQAAAACVGLSLLFITFAGNNSSLNRAAWVGGLSLAAWYYGRRVQPVVLLIVAATATAFLNPLELWGNVSWWLSFLAFAGILLWAPPPYASFVWQSRAAITCGNSH